MNASYPHLLAPITLGSVELRTRVIMGSMHTGLEEQPQGFERLAEFYRLRAKHDVGLIVTGGIAPNAEGAVIMGAAKLTTEKEIEHHRQLTDAVHQEGGKICMQILHAGRYAYNPKCVAPSAIQSPITPFKPRELSAEDVEQTIADFIHCAQCAHQAGYDGVEIMGSEGYLINQFLAQRTNQRQDEWGGDLERRMRFPLRIVEGIRAAFPKDFIILFRISMLDLVEGGSTLEEILEFAKHLEKAGIDAFNTGIGWHEARIPTIATLVPRAAFTWASATLKKSVSLPVIACNRINTPEVAESVLANGDADLVSMARPFLADPEFVTKAANDKADFINTCIACNQACLDHTFSGKLASCLVNPIAGRETEVIVKLTDHIKRVAVIGAGPAGMACAVTAAQCGHDVVLFERHTEIGGQFNLAKQIPGKEEFYETLRYFQHQLNELSVDVRLKTEAHSDALIQEGFDHVVIATGVLPRIPPITGIDHPKVLGYIDVLKGAAVGKSVAVIGAGGIGFDVSEFLTHDAKHQGPDLNEFLAEWGIDPSLKNRGGLTDSAEDSLSSAREVFLLQRKTTKLGQDLGKTTGWIHRTQLKRRGVNMLNGVNYLKIDDEGLHIEVNDQTHCLAVDNVVLCAGQESNRTLWHSLSENAPNLKLHRIGGAEMAGELDAKRAIKEGVELAVSF
ncbi:MAG: NADPH-dependent 2,4-dienoyl-CoA reductase [Pseudomonadota bacterium]